MIFRENIYDPSLLRIRYATHADIEAVFSIETGIFQTPWSYSSIESELTTSFSRFSVALYDNAVIGYAVAWEVSGEIQLNHIAVEKKYRRYHIGSALIDFLIASLKPNGAIKLLLEVRAKNTGARMFYKNLGFTENGIRHNYYPNDDAILLEKDI
jgi:[ribosomal protein S18]-alanine N-acetyltransferase